MGRPKKKVRSVENEEATRTNVRGNIEEALYARWMRENNENAENCSQGQHSGSSNHETTGANEKQSIYFFTYYICLVFFQFFHFLFLCFFFMIV